MPQPLPDDTPPDHEIQAALQTIPHSQTTDVVKYWSAMSAVLDEIERSYPAPLAQQKIEAFFHAERQKCAAEHAALQPPARCDRWHAYRWPTRAMLPP